MKKKFIFFLFFIFLFSSNSYAQLKTYVIDQKKYINAINFAQDSNFDVQWDSALRILSLKNNKMTIKILDQQDSVLLNDEILFLNNKVVSKDGSTFLPYDFLEKIGKKAEPRVVEKIIEEPIIVYQPKQGPKTVVIDAGHGGNDPGAVGLYGALEKDVVLDIALRLKKILLANGYKVVMTRSKDVFISLPMRSKIANKAQADIFVSIHANASKDRTANGMEIYYLSDQMNDYERSMQAAHDFNSEYESSLETEYTYDPTQTKAVLWDLICDAYRKESLRLANYVSSGMAANKVRLDQRGTKSARFYVLKNTLLPAILIEVGFVSNPKEERDLAKAEIRNQIAQGISKSIQKFFSEYEKTKGFSA